MDSPGFKRFKARRAAAATEDQDYQAFTAAMRGPDPDANGRASHLEPGGEDPAEGLSDGEIYAGYMSVLSGEAGRRTAQETVRRELQEREAATVRHVREVGGGLSRSNEHLRSRIPGAGKPYEGG